MKFAGRLSGAVLLMGAMFLLAGCNDPEPGKSGTIPPAWDEPGTPRGMANRSDSWGTTDESDPAAPGEWGAGGDIDERTGVRRLDVPGFPKTLYFGYDTDQINASENGKIAEAAGFMLANPGLVLVIEGHCDERGTEEYNRALGERRAIAVENRMRANNVDLANIRTVSYGEDQPAAAGSGESAWSQNRRAVLWVGKAAN